MRLTLILVFGILLGCDPIDDKLVVKNPTDKKIYFIKNPHRDLPTMYQETAKQQGKNLSYMNFIYEVEPDTTKKMLITGGGEAWRRYINKACEDGKLRIYTFSIDTLKKYSWEEVMGNNYYISRMEFSVDDLDKQEWVIDLTSGRQDSVGQK